MGGASVIPKTSDVNLYHMSYIRQVRTNLAGREAVTCGEIRIMNPAPSSSATLLADAGSGAPSAPTFSPLYRQIKQLIMQNLQSGEWRPGKTIPSEQELAACFGVSQGTVRKAIDELSAENLLVRKQGKGTYVATHSEARAQFRFLRLKPDAGDAHYPDNSILDAKRLRAPADIARQLEIKTGDSVLFIKRLQSFDGAPTILEELWLPGMIFKGLSAERMQQYKGPMYALLETEFGVRMIRAAEDIRAVAADRETAARFAVAVNTPLLSVQRLSFTYGDRPVEVRRSLYLTAHHHYQNELS